MMVVAIFNSHFQLQSFLSQPYINADLLIYLSSDKVSDNVKSHIDTLKFKKLATFKRSYTLKRKSFLIASPIIRCFLNLFAKSIIIGDIRSPYLIAPIPFKKTVSKYLVDDGAASLYNLHLNSIPHSTVALNINRVQGWSLSSIAFKLALKTKFLQSRHISDFNIITMFDSPFALSNVLYFNPKLNDDIVKLTSDFKEHQVFDGACFVLGGKYSEIGLMNEERYLDYLRFIIQDKKDEKLFYYISHRGESIDKLLKVQDIGYLIFHCPSGCESFFFDIGTKRIGSIVGFYTTALLILSKYLNKHNSLYYIDLRYDLKDKRYLDAISLVYDFLIKDEKLIRVRYI